MEPTARERLRTAAGEVAQLRAQADALAAGQERAREAVRDASRAVKAAREAVEDSSGIAAAHMVATALGKTTEAPPRGRQARMELAGAEDDLAAADGAAETLLAQRREVESTLQYAQGRRDAALRATIVESDAFKTLMADMRQAETEQIKRFRDLAWLVRFGYADGTLLHRALRPVVSGLLPGVDVMVHCRRLFERLEMPIAAPGWEAAVAALHNDPDALLPGEKPKDTKPAAKRAAA